MPLLLPLSLLPPFHPGRLLLIGVSLLLLLALLLQILGLMLMVLLRGMFMIMGMGMLLLLHLLYTIKGAMQTPARSASPPDLPLLAMMNINFFLNQN